MARPSRTGGKTRSAKMPKASSATGRNAAKTKRRIAPSASRSKRSSVSSLGKELKEAREQQAATSELLKVIGRSTFDLQPVFETLAENAGRLCEAKRSFIFRFDGQYLRVVATHNVSAEIKAFVEQNPIAPGRASATARAALEQRTVHVLDAQTDPEYTYGSRLVEPFRTILTVPMLKAGELLGVILVYRLEMRPFTDSQIALLETFADQAVIAIENSRLFNETKEALERQTATADVLNVISRSPTDAAPVFEVIGERAENLCNAEISVVSVLDGDLIRVAGIRGISRDGVEHVRANFPMPLDRQTVTARTISSGTVVHIGDVLADSTYDNKGLAAQTGYRSCLGVPMHNRGKIAGAIFVARTEPGLFSENQIRLLQIFADQAVIAIQNVKMFQEVQERTRDLQESLQQQTAAADVLKLISRSTFDLQSVLNTLLESAATLCDADHAWLFQREGKELQWLASYGHSTDVHEKIRSYFSTFRVPIDRGAVTGRAALEGRTIHVSDVLADPEYALSDLQQIGSYRAALGVPLLRKGEVVGVIFVAKPEPQPFTEKQIELVTTFADQALIAIENTRLVSELRESLQQQTATADVLKVISRSTVELNAVLATLVQSARDLCNAPMGVIFLRHGDVYRISKQLGYPPEFEQYLVDNPVRANRGSGAGRAALTGQVAHIPDVLADPEYSLNELQRHGRYRVVLSVPLLREGEVVGVFSLSRTESVPFTPRQIELVHTFADQAVIAIENVRLFDEVQAKTRDLEESLQQQTATADVLKAISRSAFDLETVLNALVETAAKLCEADQGTIARQHGDAFVRVASWGFSLEFNEMVRKVPVKEERSSASGRALLERRTIHIADIDRDSEYTFADAKKLGGFKTIVAVPMLREGVPIGVLALTRIEKKPFTLKQIELVETFSDQAAIAIENVRLFEQVQARTCELTKSLEELRAT